MVSMVDNVVLEGPATEEEHRAVIPTVTTGAPGK